MTGSRRMIKIAAVMVIRNEADLLESTSAITRPRA